MAEIQLQHLVKALDRKLDTDNVEDVIAACRHILSHYPKYGAVYRLLARAFIQSNRWQEARDILYRLLGALPDDFATHIQLGEVYAQLEMPRHAIWHFARARAQDHENARLIDRLRSLHPDTHPRDFDPDEISQETIVWHHLKAARYKPALNTLDELLAISPERVDLWLLQARALWESGRYIDAANRAIAIIRAFPYCLDANAILAQARSSRRQQTGAQLYLNRVKELDPYMASKIAGGGKPDEPEFTIEEFDPAVTEETDQKIAAEPHDLLPDLSDIFMRWIEQWISQQTQRVSMQSYEEGASEEILESAELNHAFKEIPPERANLFMVLNNAKNAGKIPQSLKQLAARAFSNRFVKLKDENRDMYRRNKKSESVDKQSPSLLDHDDNAAVFAPPQLHSEIITGDSTELDTSAQNLIAYEDYDEKMFEEEVETSPAENITTNDISPEPAANLRTMQTMPAVSGLADQQRTNGTNQNSRASYEWLNDLINEESHYIRTLPEARFEFSNLPVWMRKQPESLNQTAEMPEKTAPFKRKRKPTPETHIESDDDFLSWLDQ